MKRPFRKISFLSLTIREEAGEGDFRFLKRPAEMAPFFDSFLRGPVPDAKGRAATESARGVTDELTARRVDLCAAPA
jgi:hypothetical protein